MQIKFQFEYSTKHMHRYKEIDEGRPLLVRTFYISRAAFPGRPPQYLVITVQDNPHNI